MIVVTGEFEFDAASVDAVKSAMREMVAETLKEDGCITYAFWQDIDRPGHFRVYEEWESDAHLEAHFATAHMAAFRGAIGGALNERNVKKMSVGTATDL